MPYTRKRIVSRKENPNESIEIDLHRLLNRIDVEKDAIKTHKPIVGERYNSFSRYANELFGELPYSSYAQSYNYVDEKLKTYNATDYKNISIAGAFDKHILSIIPDYIKIATQDAGFSPKQHFPHLKYLVTPGSYMDPASRSPGDIFSEFGTTISHKEFVSLGIYVINSLHATLHSDNSCTIQLDINGSIIKTRFNNNYVPIEGDKQYFVGNSVKNTWFNTHSLITKDEAVKYILCKEIGDMLQVYYGVKFMKRYTVHPTELCMFTNDNIMSMRCKLLQLQVVYSIVRGDSNNIFYHYPVMSEITAKFIQMHKQNAIHKNTMMQAALNKILQKNYYFKHDGSIVRFSTTSRIANMLKNCINEIQHQSDKLTLLDVSNISVEDYRLLSRIYTASTLFVNGVLNPGVRHLFIEHSPGTRLFSPSFGNSLHGGAIITETASELENDIEITQSKLPEYEHIYSDFRVVTTLDENTLPTTLILNTIYKNQVAMHPDWSETRLLYSTEFIYDVIFMQFSYHCLAIWNESIVKELITEYDLSYLGEMTYIEFKPMIDYLMDKYLPPKGLEEEGDMPDISNLPKILLSLESPSQLSTRKTRRKPRS